MQRLLFQTRLRQPSRRQPLKWVGNKQRFAGEIVSFFPSRVGRYFEPFLGSGRASHAGAAQGGRFGQLPSFDGDLADPRDSPATLKSWYAQHWRDFISGDRVEQYRSILASYNARPNGADLLFLCRACYGGVVRFRKADGCMSTPIGVHAPIRPESFARRVDEWHRRVAATQFLLMDYQEAMAMPQRATWCIATLPTATASRSCMERRTSASSAPGGYRRM